MSGMSIDDLANSTAFGGGKGRRERGHVPARARAARARATRSSRSTTTSSSHRTRSPAASRASSRTTSRASSPPTTAARRGCGRASCSRTSGSTRWPADRSTEYGFEPTRFDEMRRGAWDVHARVADMDIDGVYASLCFPSFLPGFVGQRLTLWPDDDELALAAMRAYNDWHLDAWAGAHPDRFIPNQITYLRDPEIAAEEIRRNAERGFKAVTFSEAPDKLGLPTIHSGHWDPLFAACAETEHGAVPARRVSSGTSPTTSDDAPPEIPAVLFGAYGMYSAVDWLYSKVPVRFPDIRICLSEGGIGWVAGHPRSPRPLLPYQLGYLPTWRDVAEPPSEVLRRNFWFCALDDDAGMLVRDRIGVEHILVESDYPHADSSWPDTQAMLVRQLERSGRRRRRRAPDHVAERVRAVPSSGAGGAAALTRGRDDARRGRRVANARERPDAPAFVEAASGDTADVRREYDDVVDAHGRRAARLGLGTGRPRRVPVRRRTRSPTRCSSRARRPGSSASESARVPGARERDHLRGAHRRPARWSPTRRAVLASAPTGATPRRDPTRRRRALVPQLDVGNDRAAEVRHARPAAVVRLPRVRARRRELHRRTTCSSARCRCRSGSGCGRRTSRRRSPARRASSSSASRPTTVLAAIERHRVTVLAAVSTQFVMMLEDRRRSSAATCRRCASCSRAARWCRTTRAKEFEDRTGATVLQFYGSQRDRRAVGDDARRPAGEAAAHRGPRDPGDARAAARPRHRRRHHRDRRTRAYRPARARPAASATGTTPPRTQQLFTADGWMRMGDLATIDADGYLTVVGRTSDFIIRGGKNISAAAGRGRGRIAPRGRDLRGRRRRRPAARRARLRVRASCAPDRPLDLDDLRTHLEARGTGKELWPERLVVLDELPRVVRRQDRQGAAPGAGRENVVEGNLIAENCRLCVAGY